MMHVLGHKLGPRSHTHLRIRPLYTVRQENVTDSGVASRKSSADLRPRRGVPPGPRRAQQGLLPGTGSRHDRHPAVRRPEDARIRGDGQTRFASAPLPSGHGPDFYGPHGCPDPSTARCAAEGGAGQAGRGTVEIRGSSGSHARAISARAGVFPVRGRTGPAGQIAGFGNSAAGRANGHKHRNSRNRQNTGTVETRQNTETAHRHRKHEQPTITENMDSSQIQQHGGHSLPPPGGARTERPEPRRFVGVQGRSPCTPQTVAGKQLTKQQKPTEG